MGPEVLRRSLERLQRCSQRAWPEPNARGSSVVDSELFKCRRWPGVQGARGVECLTLQLDMFSLCDCGFRRKHTLQPLQPKGLVESKAPRLNVGGNRVLPEAAGSYIIHGWARHE